MIRPESPGPFQVFFCIQVEEAEEIGIERPELIYGNSVDAQLLQRNVNSPLSVFQRPLARGLHLLPVIDRMKRLEKPIGLHRNCGFIRNRIIRQFIRQLIEPLDHLRFQERQIASRGERKSAPGASHTRFQACHRPIAPDAVTGEDGL